MPHFRLLNPPRLAVCLALIPLALASQVNGLDLSVHESDLVPNVTLQEHENRTVEEYRINGRLYMIKIVPAFGPPYFFIDNDGDGNMETRATDFTLIRVPQWVLATW
jgi:hypothetical protein